MTTDRANKALAAKRQTPSWGITKADLMRMHAAVVDKLNARIKALESTPSVLEALEAVKSQIESLGMWSSKEQEKRGINTDCWISRYDALKIIEGTLKNAQRTASAPDARMEEAVEAVKALTKGAWASEIECYNRVLTILESKLAGTASEGNEK